MWFNCCVFLKYDHFHNHLLVLAQLMGYVWSCINVEKKIIKEICWELNDSKSFVSKKFDSARTCADSRIRFIIITKLYNWSSFNLFPHILLLKSLPLAGGLCWWFLVTFYVLLLCPRPRMARSRDPRHIWYAPYYSLTYCC